MFKTNVGGFDRVLRIVVGLALIALWYFNPEMGLRWLPLILGIVALATGLLSTCPLYSILGISTCPLKKV
ncbi:MAG: YgaP family membrane protein [Albidovulum sp.]